MDYTSVSNIMKVIRPLFLDELEEEFEKIIEGDILPKTKIERLQKLWERISKIKIFDQTTPNMIQRISGIFERNALISKEI